VDRLHPRPVMRRHPAARISRIAVWGQANEKPPSTMSSDARRISCAAYPSVCSEFGELVSGCHTGFTDSQSDGPTGCLGLRQQHCAPLEDSKQAFFNRFFTGGGWT
jgi:hypothetical protein